jgi:hypothetical protein
LWGQKLFFFARCLPANSSTRAATTRWDGLSTFVTGSDLIMTTRKPRLDIVNEVLEACILAYPVSPFIISLYQQYQERGSLSKKQMQGLYGKASNIQDLSPGKLAAIELIIKKMTTRHKGEVPVAAPPSSRDKSTAQTIAEILARFPNHKRVLFLKAKYDHEELLSPADLLDLKKFKAICDSRK